MNASRRAGLALALTSTLAPHLAWADAIEACTSTVTNGQRLQRAGKLRDARASFLACVKPECPAEVKAVCDSLLTKLEATIPTLILGARTIDGQDLVDVRVLLDGAPLLAALDGKPVSLDPGPHVLRFEHHGSTPLERTVVIREAEKERLLTVTLAEPQALPRSAPPAAPGEARPTPWSVYVLGGVGVVALGGFAYLATYGQTQYDDCRAHGCTQGAVNTLGVERGVAFGALGIGAVSLAMGTWLWFSRPTRSTQAAVPTVFRAPPSAQPGFAF